MNTSSLSNHHITSTDDEKIADAIGKASRHAKRVIRREHVKGDRLDTINQFVVSLRRELMMCFSGTLGASLVERLCNKEIWFDAGEISPSYNGHHQGPSVLQLEKWTRAAKRIAASNSSAQAELIQADLEELERSLHGFQIQIEDAERINTEGDSILVGLEELFSH
jgi:hypothetical protein